MYTKSLFFVSLTLSFLFSGIKAQTHKMAYEDFNSMFTKKFQITLLNFGEKDSLTLPTALEELSLDQVVIELSKNKVYSYLDNFNKTLILSKKPLKTIQSTSFYTVLNVQEKPAEDNTELTENQNEHKQNGVIEIGKPMAGNKKAVAISGTVNEKESGEPVIGAVVYVEDLKIGTITDYNGHFVLSIPPGRHRISFKFMGKKDVVKDILAHSNGNINIELQEKVTQLKDVTISADRNQNVAGIQMGMQKLDMAKINQIPSLTGEADLLKAALLLPGVQTVGEGSSGFNVRGGNVDQNLILFNNAPIFNPSHLFGFFSAFNPDVISNFELYKSGIPARYGGRASSVMDINSRNGNLKKFNGKGGIGLVTSRLSLEGPIKKDVATFIIGVRGTYSDWLLKHIDVPEIQNSNLSFYDIVQRYTYKVNSKNTLSLNAYYSSDYFRLSSDTTFRYHNMAASLSLKHQFSERHFTETSVIYSGYNYQVNSNSNEIEGKTTKYQINHSEFKTIFSYFPAYRHKINYGLNVINYKLNPGAEAPLGTQSLVKHQQLEQENALEGSLFIDEEFIVSSYLTIYGGIRYSGYYQYGPHTKFGYAPNQTLTTENIIDTAIYRSGQKVQTYFIPEYRINARLKLNHLTSLKLSYNRLSQYLHMLTNSYSPAPTDTWKLSDPYIKPQMADQYSLGIYRDFKKSSLEISVEGYYKTIYNFLEYKPGAMLNMNETIETELLNASGKAYGAELLIKKDQGKLNGWISYTYSRTFVKVQGDTKEETINEGVYYPANFDKPHDLSVVGNYKFSRRFSFSSTFTYSTGRPITYPVGKYEMDKVNYLVYSKRNEYRIPDYIRWDASVTLDGNLKLKKLAHSSWTLSVYNILGRDNVYSVYFITEGQQINGYKLSVFAEPIPMITYNFRF